MPDIDTSQNASPADTGAAATPPATGGDSKPTTARGAMEAAARSAATPAPAPGARPEGSAGGTGSAPAAAAIAQPAKPASPAPAGRGFVPTDEHEKAVRNARTKGADEAIQKYAWANGLDPEEVKDALRIRGMLYKDAKEFHKNLGGELEGQSHEFKLPEADLISRDGKIRTYSEARMGQIAEGIRAQVTKQIEGLIQPIMEERDQRQQQERAQEAIRAEQGNIREALTHARSLPHFKENEKAISEKLGDIPKEVRRKVGLIAAMYMAYSAVLADVGLKAPAVAEEKVLGDLKRKAAAGTGTVMPGGAAPVGGPKKPGNINELARHMEKLAAAQST